MQRYASLLFITFLVFSITSGKQLSRVIGKILCISSMGGCWRGNENHLTPHVLISTTDYGRPRCFFLGLGWQLEQINLGAFGVFSTYLSAPISVLWVPCPCFPLINHSFYKKLSLHIQIQNIYFGLGFEFGQQRIRDLAIVCP